VDGDHGQTDVSAQTREELSRIDRYRARLLSGIGRRDFGFDRIAAGLERSPRSPRRIPEFSSTPNAIDTGFLFAPAVNILVADACKR
jgi:hypothetical protein